MLTIRFAPASLVAAALLATVGVVMPGDVAGQSRCSFGDGSRSLRKLVIPGQGEVTYLGGPNFICDDGVRIRADSAVIYQSQSLAIFLGAVRFRDPQRTLVADQARYFIRAGRLQAEGHMVLRDTVSGSVIENGELVYLRQTPERAQEQITVVTGVDHVRPLATLFMAPAADSVPTATVSVDSGTVADTLPAGDTLPTADTLPAGDTLPAAASIPALDTTGAVEPPSPDTTVAVEPPALDTMVAVEPPALDTMAALEAPALDTTAVQVGDPAPPVRAPSEIPPASPPRDTTQIPYKVEADNLFLQGDQYFLATGSVYIVRDLVYARADSVEYDQVAGRMLLRRSAQVESGSFNLTGQDINIGLVGGEMSTVRAVHEAELLGESLQLTAPVISLFMVDGAPARLVAVPMRADGETLEEPDDVDLVRPVAQAEDFRLTADSLDVLAPEEVLERIYATGQARGESTARDSINVDSLPAIARSDWIEGDTVIAYFVPSPSTDEDMPPDTAGAQYTLDRLTAVGDAKSLYRLLPSDSTSKPGVDPPAVHYVTGSSITIIMMEGAVDRMEVTGPSQGWHWEPQARVAQRDTVPQDSTAVQPDTMAIPPDTIPGSPGRTQRTEHEDTPPDGGDNPTKDAALPAAVLRRHGRERRSRR